MGEQVEVGCRRMVRLEIACARLARPSPAILDTGQPLLAEGGQPLAAQHPADDTHSAHDQGRQQQREADDDNQLGERTFLLDQNEEILRPSVAQASQSTAHYQRVGIPAQTRFRWFSGGASGNNGDVRKSARTRSQTQYDG